MLYTGFCSKVSSCNDYSLSAFNTVLCALKYALAILKLCSRAAVEFAIIAQKRHKWSKAA